MPFEYSFHLLCNQPSCFRFIFVSAGSVFGTQYYPSLLIRANTLFRRGHFPMWTNLCGWCVRKIRCGDWLLLMMMSKLCFSVVYIRVLYCL